MVALGDRLAFKRAFISDSERTIGMAARHILSFSGSPGNAVPNSGLVEEKPYPLDDAHRRPTLDEVPAPTSPPPRPPWTVMSDGAPDDIEKVTRLLDAAFDLPRGAVSPCVWANKVPCAEYAFRLWASAHQFELADQTVQTGHVLTRRFDIYEQSTGRLIAGLQWPPTDVH